MSGYLRMKKSKNGAKWKRFWFILKDGILYSYKAPEDSMACDTFPILGFILETLSEVRILQCENHRHFSVTQILREIKVGESDIF